MLKVQKHNVTLSLDESSLSFGISADGFSWVSQGKKPYVTIRKKVGKKYIKIRKLLTSAKEKSFSSDDGKITARLSGFSAFGKSPFTLVCTAEITEESRVVFSVKAENETDLSVASVYFPGAFNAVEYSSGYAVEPVRQGFIMPDGYHKNPVGKRVMFILEREINTGDWYHPFFGRVCGGHGYSAILETPYDAKAVSQKGKNDSFLTGVNWLSSLGKLSYERRLRLDFFSKGDYNSVAKNFRAYLKETGQFVSIADKIERNPNIAYLVGAPVLHHRIYTHIQPKSDFYKKHGQNIILYSTFEQRAKELEKIKSLGLDRLYIHTDGWGIEGYDNQHPYVLPPNEKAGGRDGMKKLADKCLELGYCFGLHDQYRDFYYDCKYYDKNLAVMNIDGSNPYCDIWDGGAHSWLCSTQALGFVERTYNELKSYGIHIGGSYLDVFGVVAGDECFNPNHRATREESIKERGKCFDFLNENGIIPSSEEAASQLMDKLALVHHAPYQVTPQGGGKAVGIPVPLTSLVYHDCVFVPWVSGGKNGWGIPNTDNSKLHCVLNSGTPYFYPHKYVEKPTAHEELKAEAELRAEIENAKELAAIQARLYDKEMIKHEFVGGNLRVQRAVYSDSTVITVDFDKDEYTIE